MNFLNLIWFHGSDVCPYCKGTVSVYLQDTLLLWKESLIIDSMAHAISNQAQHPVNGIPTLQGSYKQKLIQVTNTHFERIAQTQHLNHMHLTCVSHFRLHEN